MVQDNEFLPPQDIAGMFYQKYEPREVLGKGASSTVRRCLLKETGESYAVKIIDVSHEAIDADGLNLREQTLREVNILRLVQGHKYIINLVDVFESPTYIFLVFELCPNGELFDYLTSQVTLSEKRAKRIMKQVLLAVQHCHAHKVVHRDIKPENILLDKDFNVKLTDFGFAKVLEPNERLYEVCGTPGYLAPELLRSGMVEKEECEGYGMEVDVWACGVILYTLLVGFPPFWNRKQLAMIRSIMEGKFSFTSTEWRDVTAAPKDLISRILVVDYRLRPTVDQCLKHEFFRALVSGGGRHDSESEEPFQSRRVFRKAVILVRFLIRLQRLKLTPQPLSLSTASLDPYRIRTFRKVIDGAAFKIYGHWVKKNDGQNRAAMFEHSPKIDLSRRSAQQGANEHLNQPVSKVVFIMDG